jgi:hypothetical protein
LDHVCEGQVREMIQTLLAYMLHVIMGFVFASGGDKGANTWIVLGVGLVVGLLQGLVLWILNDIRQTLKVTVSKEMCELHRHGVERRLETIELNVGITGVRHQPPFPGDR